MASVDCERRRTKTLIRFVPWRWRAFSTRLGRRRTRGRRASSSLDWLAGKALGRFKGSGDSEARARGTARVGLIGGWERDSKGSFRVCIA